MLAVIDTNVLISGFISNKSFPAKVLDFWVLDKFKPVVSSEIIKEYSAVLIRNKFSVLGSIEERLDLLGRLLSFDQVILVNPQQKINAIKDDPRDNIFLECAVAGDCELIVSGDQHLLQLEEYNGIKIITARDFIIRVEIIDR
ncbi:putative toxin-antitoxin system toxin component, PIN family [Calorimonas adulescens]|uniref:Putative toxin-antitoxin system toxin component, PIN family n=1 Tax=Calorimonas adulescens TaxID=2606906 RepID=A0A5D8Q9U4_9THEO|nr:putative toxin-antitoxin system toxin component, PIN family [Calorimonas adulescens]TZE80954.1 putative toxin-antitoxin system toxin component, PIN family [Calorimonas adulescens]